MEGSGFAKHLETIKKCIKSWNFSDDDEGKIPTPITVQNLEKFADNDLKVLLESISGKNIDELIKI